MLEWLKDVALPFFGIAWTIYLLVWIILKETSSVDYRLPSGSKFRLWKRRDKVDKPR